MGEESATSQFRFASEMDRVFESEEFSRSPVMRRLLRFLIDQTIAGNGDQLKAYSVAVDGLGRDPDFDAQTDSYPRVQVGRLRRMLDAHYARNGFPNGERLVIPNGAYRVYLNPVFHRPERLAPIPKSLVSRKDERPPLLESAPESPPLAVSFQPQHQRKSRLTEVALIIALLVAAALALLLAYLVPSAGRPLPPRDGLEITRAPNMLLLPVERSVTSPANLAPSIDQVLGDALHRSWVVNIQSADEARSSSGGAAQSHAYSLQSVLAGPRGEDLYLTLWNNRRGDRIWTDHIDLAGRETALEAALRLPVANLIGSFGAIAAQERQRFGTRVAPGYSCLLKNAELRIWFSPANLEASRKCLDQTFAANQISPAVLAASVAVNYRLSAFKPEEAGKLRAKAQAHAKQALLLDPYSADAQMASATLAVLEGRCQLGKALGLRAVELNPYEPEYYARLGLLLFQCGDPGHEKYLTIARQMNPQLPAFFSFPVIAAMGERGEGRAALQLALSLPTSSTAQMPLYSITLALAHANNGDRARAVQYWRQLAMASGNAGKTPRQILSGLLISPNLSRRTGQTLIKAGIIDRLD